MHYVYGPSILGNKETLIFDSGTIGYPAILILTSIWHMIAWNKDYISLYSFQLGMAMWLKSGNGIEIDVLWDNTQEPVLWDNIHALVRLSDCIAFVAPLGRDFCSIK